MARELPRFLHLERARPAREGDATPAPAPAERFASVERPGDAPASAPTPTGVPLERFGPEPEPSLELAPTDDAARPFTRCPTCGRDHGRDAAVCSGCGAALDSEAARAFNDRLWAERRAESAREAAAAATRGAGAAGGAVQDRKLLEALAREVGDAERKRLDLEGISGGGWSSAPDLRVLLAWLWQSGWLVRIVLAGVALVLLAVAASARGAPVAPLIPLVVLGLLFPRRRRR